MNESSAQARRYHWQSEELPGFFDSPHTAIDGKSVGQIINLADARAGRSRAAGLELVREGRDRTISVLRRWGRSGSNALSLFPETEPLDTLAPPPLGRSGRLYFLQDC